MSFFASDYCYTIKSFKIKTVFQTALALGSVLWKMAKNGNVHEGGKVGRSNATLTKLFSVDSYDLKSMLFKFGNAILNTFEMPST